MVVGGSRRDILVSIGMVWGGGVDVENGGPVEEEGDVKYGRWGRCGHIDSHLGVSQGLVADRIDEGKGCLLNVTGGGSIQPCAKVWLARRNEELPLASFKNWVLYYDIILYY